MWPFFRSAAHLRQLVAFVISFTRYPAGVYLPPTTVQISEQRFCFNGCREVQSFAYAPLAIELVYDQVGISIDRHSPWRARTQVFQDVEYACVFRNVVGHGTALTDQAVLPHKDGTILVFDHHSVGSGSSGIDRSTSSIKPGSVFVVFDQAHLTIWAVVSLGFGLCPPVTTVQGSLTR